MQGKLIIWGEWNRSHITGHGGSCVLAESIITDDATTWELQDNHTAKGFAVVIDRAWTLVVMFDRTSVYPVTMYPTKRGKRSRKKP
jgi:hypothetical protein